MCLGNMIRRARPSSRNFIRLKMLIIHFWKVILMIRLEILMLIFF